MAAALLIGVCAVNAFISGWCVAKIRDIYRRIGTKGKE